MDLKLVFFNLIFIVSTITMYSFKATKGNPLGFLSDCPGSEKKAVITKKGLKYVNLVVHGEGPYLSARRKKYSYHQMSKLAKDPDIDFSKKTMLYNSGYLDSPNLPLARTLAVLYKKLGYNFLSTDYNYFATKDYPVSARYIRAVGKRVAEMLAELSKNGLDPKNLEMIGISLGGQTMGFVAKNYQAITGRNVSFLIGLDPSGPCFRHQGPENRLDKSDADFVLVIKTNMDGYGMAAPIGHVNFYVNGGEYQIGDLYWLPCTMFCSHIRSFFIWVASLQYPKSFIAIKCDTVTQARYQDCFSRQPRVTNILSPLVNKSEQGIFYLSTDNKWPYALGKNGLKQKLNEVDLIASMNKADVIET